MVLPHLVFLTTLVLTNLALSLAEENLNSDQIAGRQSSTNVVFSHGHVERSDREANAGHKGVTVWMTGLSGAGKSAVAMETEKQLLGDHGMHVYRLDGDNLRFGLNGDLGFSEKDRAENVRRTAEVSLLLADAGLISICALISPFKADRDRARQIHEKASVPFLEVFVDAPLAVAEQRDPKGLYKKARAGKIKSFTGLDSPYEAPEKPEVHLNSNEVSAEDNARRLVDEIWFASRLATPYSKGDGKSYNSIRDYQEAKFHEYNETYTERESRAAENDRLRAEIREKAIQEQKERKAAMQAARRKAAAEKATEKQKSEL